jgi:hypothetical protein
LDEVLAAACACDLLSDWEMVFAHDMRGLFDKWGRRTRISDKRRAVLRRIESRLRKMGLL